MKTKLLSILLATIMFVSLLPTTAFAGGEAPEACDHETWTKWGVDAPEKKSLPSSAGSYYLTDNVTLSGTWTVPSGTVNLCLNGYVIKQTVESSVICVPEGAELNIYDCSSTTHKFKDGDGGLWMLDDTLT